MPVLELHLTAEQHDRVQRLAEAARVSPQEAILRAVERALSAEGPVGGDGSAFPSGSPLYGMDALLDELGDGPTDLSSNKDHLDGYGR